MPARRGQRLDALVARRSSGGWPRAAPPRGRASASAQVDRARTGRHRARGAAHRARRPSAPRAAPPAPRRPSPTRRRSPPSPSRATRRAPGSRGWPAAPAARGRCRRRRRSRLAALGPLVGLDRLPVAQHLRGTVGDLHVAEDVRVAADDLGGNGPIHVGQVEVALLGRELRMQDDLEEEVAELLGKVGRAAALDGIDRLVRLLEHDTGAGSGWVCLRSQGQPSGARSRALMAAMPCGLARLSSGGSGGTSQSRRRARLRRATRALTVAPSGRAPQRVGGG